MSISRTNFRIFPHDWQSNAYVSEWIAQDVTRDDERRPEIQRMLATAAFSHDLPIDVLDVGAGYGVVTEEVLKVMPNAHVVLQDYSRAMLDRARERLGNRAQHLRYVLCDLTDRSWPKKVGGPFDLAVSAIALHNLGDRTKIFSCYRAIYGLLKPGGYFLDYDRFPGGVARHLAALQDAGFQRVKCILEKQSIAIVVAGPKALALLHPAKSKPATKAAVSPARRHRPIRKSPVRS
jgi:ubiquinone/menaquinone biosynthesis C-methylase UbiE